MAKSVIKQEYLDSFRKSHENIWKNINPPQTFLGSTFNKWLKLQDKEV